MMTDPIADVLTRVRNAQRARHRSVIVRASKVAKTVHEVLKKEGFIESFAAAAPVHTATTTSSKRALNEKFPKFEVVLRYYESGEPLISRLERVSPPGQRVYAPVEKLPRVFAGLGMAILSTSKGVMSDREARKAGVGGEVIARVG
jgi:small subunit ribosomal protein S8